MQGRLSQLPFFTLTTPFSRSLIIPSVCFEIIGFQPRHLHTQYDQYVNLVMHPCTIPHTYGVQGARVLGKEYGKRTPRQGVIRNRHASCSTDKPDDDDNAGPLGCSSRKSFLGIDVTWSMPHVTNPGAESLPVSAFHGLIPERITNHHCPGGLVV